jgi:hypothetical protein
VLHLPPLREVSRVVSVIAEAVAVEAVEVAVAVVLAEGALVMRRRSGFLSPSWVV